MLPKSNTIQAHAQQTHYTTRQFTNSRDNSRSNINNANTNSHNNTNLLLVNKENKFQSLLAAVELNRTSHAGESRQRQNGTGGGAQSQMVKDHYQSHREFGRDLSNNHINNGNNNHERASHQNPQIINAKVINSTTNQASGNNISLFKNFISQYQSGTANNQQNISTTKGNSYLAHSGNGSAHLQKLDLNKVTNTYQQLPNNYPSQRGLGQVSTANIHLNNTSSSHNNTQTLNSTGGGIPSLPPTHNNHQHHPQQQQQQQVQNSNMSQQTINLNTTNGGSTGNNTTEETVKKINQSSVNNSHLPSAGGARAASSQGGTHNTSGIMPPSLIMTSHDRTLNGNAGGGFGGSRNSLQMHSQQSVAQMTHQIREQLRGKHSANSHIANHHAATTRRNGIGEEFRRVGQQLTSDINKTKDEEKQSALSTTIGGTNTSVSGTGVNNTSHTSCTIQTQNQNGVNIPISNKSGSIVSRQTAAQQILQQKALNHKLMNSNTQRTAYSTNGNSSQMSHQNSSAYSQVQSLQSSQIHYKLLATKQSFQNNNNQSHHNHNNNNQEDKENKKEYLNRQNIPPSSQASYNTGSSLPGSAQNTNNVLKRSKTSDPSRAPLRQKENQQSYANQSSSQSSSQQQQQTNENTLPSQNTINSTINHQQEILFKDQLQVTTNPISIAATIQTPQASSHQPKKLSQETFALVAQIMEDRRKERMKTLTRNLEVCDLLDMRNPQSVAEFAPQIYKHMHQEELGHLYPKDFMTNQSEITEKMRAYLIDWLTELHLKFKLWPETLFVCIGLIDKFLMVEKDFKKKDLQSLGLTALHVAGKYEEIYPPELKNILKVTDNAVTKDQVLKLEYRILQNLDFNVTFPSIFRFMERYSRIAQVNERTQMLASYLCESCLLDCTLMKERPSKLAAVSLYAAQRVMKGAQATVWNATLTKNTSYKEEEVRGMAIDLLQFIKNVEGSSLQSIYKKYCSPKYLEVARLLA